MATKLVKTDLDFEGVARLKQVPPATQAGEVVVFEQLQSAIQAQAWKDSARVASTGNINLSAPGAAIDGITMTSGDRVLVKNQSSGAENGVYIWNGAATPMTRAPDADTFDKLEAAYIPIEEGTVNAQTAWRQTAVNGTIGSSAVTWVAFGVNAPDASETVKGVIEIATSAETNAGTDTTRALTPARLKDASFVARKSNHTVGDGSNTQFTLSHNLGTFYPLIGFTRIADGIGIVAAYEVIDADSIRVSFAAAPATNSIAVAVIG